ncbi:hypothetical protein [Staphylococcus succinus]|uniref:hypothetical protein n=1 Tax=Staphylococcus succinus TaxID=61015 RepID=UPI00301C727A
MTSAINKNALFKMKSEPHLKPISDLEVGYYNLDENTATLRFQLSNSVGPLQISKENATAYAYFKSSNGSATDVIELNVEDEFDGLFTITLDKEFLQAATSTKVIGQVYVAVNNKDGDPAYNEVAVFREFTFQVADALINQISSFTKIEYIRMFDQLKSRIEQTVREIQEAIANGADYVAEMKAVLQQGIDTINKLVSDSQTSMTTFIETAKADLNTISNDAVEDITTLSNTTKTSVQEASTNAINSINTTSTNATTHVDGKVAEFNATVEANGFVTPEKLTTDLDALQWQKFKLTADDGSYETIALEGNIEALHALTPGRYYLTTTPITGASSTAGYAKVESRKGISNIKIITFKPYNSGQIWVKRYYNTWNEWEKVSGDIKDTGWITFELLNGALSNTAYQAEGDGGFQCAYRTITNGTTVTRKLRLNGSNLTIGQTLTKLPTGFVKNAQTFPVRIPTKYAGGYVVMRPDGEVKLYINGDDTAWESKDYAYGELTWHD